MNAFNHDPVVIQGLESCLVLRLVNFVMGASFVYNFKKFVTKRSKIICPDQLSDL